jgi:hypothetical protein
MAPRLTPSPGRKPGVPNVKRLPLLPKGGVTERHVALAFKLAADGRTDVEIADHFGVSERCISLWKNASAAFRDALIEGRQIAAASVVKSLYRAAMGQNKIKTVTVITGGRDPRTVVVEAEVPPDTKAAIQLMAVWDPKRWGRKRDDEYDAECDARALESMIGLLPVPLRR